MRKIVLCLGLIAVPALYGQSVGATFGEVTRLSGTPSDIVLDESRECLYLVNTNANRVDIQNPRPKGGRVANKNRPHSISG